MRKFVKSGLENFGKRLTADAAFGKTIMKRFYKNERIRLERLQTIVIETGSELSERDRKWFLGRLNASIVLFASAYKKISKNEEQDLRDCEKLVFNLNALRQSVEERTEIGLSEINENLEIIKKWSSKL